MKQTLLWKLVFILAAVVACILAVTGIPGGLSWSAIRASTISRIHLGLDLQGGTHLILQVHVDDAVRSETAQGMARLQADLAANGVGFTSLTQPDPQAHPETLQIQGVPVDKVNDFQRRVAAVLGNEYDTRAVASGTFTMSLTNAAVGSIKDSALEHTIQIINNRVNLLGVTEPTVQPHGLGAYEILVQLPGLSDEARVQGIIQNTAMLEMRLVKDQGFSSEAEARAKYGGVLPPDSAILPGNSIGAGQGSTTQYYVVSSTSVISGSDLRDAEPTLSSNTGAWEVNFTLTRDAGQRFGAWTQANLHKNLAVVLDNKVVEAAEIRDRITDQGVIEGQFTRQEAADLSLILRSGALPATITYLDNEVVGPSLGADSIHDGIMASIVGFVVIALFMLFYYHGAGFNAVLALVLNLLILMAYMAVAKATLTLPGIAGIILTIGMAVDSNVLIFERIREEMRQGKSVPASVDIGFRQALKTIIDTHITTVASAICLFLFGTGPIKGFAVTLTIGLIANLFTAVFISRAIFDYLLMRQQAVRGAHLSIG